MMGLKGVSHQILTEFSRLYSHHPIRPGRGHAVMRQTEPSPFCQDLLTDPFCGFLALRGLQWRRTRHRWNHRLYFDRGEILDGDVARDHRSLTSGGYSFFKQIIAFA